MSIDKVPVSTVRDVIAFMSFGYFGEERYAGWDNRLSIKYPDYQVISDLLLHS